MKLSNYSASCSLRCQEPRTPSVHIPPMNGKAVARMMVNEGELGKAFKFPTPTCAGGGGSMFLSPDRKGEVGGFNSTNA